MATAFNVSVMPSAGDYSTLQGIFTAAGTIDLTSAATKVFAITGGITGTMTDNTAVTGLTSGATGTCVHASSVNSQILIKSITGVFQNGEIVYENLGTNYVTLNDAGASPSLNVVISGTWASADTTAVTITGFTTSTTSTITISATGVARNNGVWSTSAYRLSPAAGAGITISGGLNTTIDGLQILAGTGTYFGAINISNYQSNITIKNNILVSSGAAGVGGIYHNQPRGNNYIYNNVIYNASGAYADGYGNAGSSGDGDSNTHIYVYNNTFYNCTNGIQGILNGGTFVATNNVVVSCGTACFTALTKITSGTNNASSDGTANSSPLTSGLINKTTYANYFTDYTNKNFNLKSSSDFIGQGTDLSVTFTTDITGATRTAPWDIGAFKYAGSATKGIMNLKTGWWGDL